MARAHSRLAAAVAVAAAVMGGAGCEVCTAEDVRTFVSLECARGPVPGSVRLRPTAAVRGTSLASQRCLGTLDGGEISLRLQGLACAEAEVNHTQLLFADCEVSGLMPGTYTVSDAPLTSTPDGGVAPASFTVEYDGGLDISRCQR